LDTIKNKMSTQQWREENIEKMRQYRRNWYRKNKERAKKRVLKRKNELKEWFRNLKSQLNCERCGENHPACLEFHHLEPNIKEENLSVAVANYGWSKDKILKEIEKCVVLCSNCHRKIHWDLKIQTGSQDNPKKSIRLNSRKVDRPSKDVLKKMVWEKPTTHIAKDFGVSDKAIEKWCKAYGIDKPPRGYWAKKNQSVRLHL
jgi:transcription elongation factor Elf1